RGAVSRSRVRAFARRRVAGAGHMALVRGRTGLGVAACAGTGLTGIGLGAGVAVAARGAVRRSRAGALAGAGVAGAGHMALARGRTSLWVAHRARPTLTGIVPLPGALPIARGAVSRSRVRAFARRRVAGAGHMALVRGRAGHRVAAHAGARLTG